MAQTRTWDLLALASLLQPEQALAVPREREMALFSFSEALIKYVILQVPGWLLAVALAWIFVRRFDVPLWAGILLIGLWIAKDVALFPRMRRFYESTLSEPRIVGDAGVAITNLDPRGFVRIHGELWQAEAGSGKNIAEGSGICVRDIRGLLLVVDALPEPYSALVRRSSSAASRREDPLRDPSSYGPSR